MHELSVALGIVRIAEDKTVEANAESVNRIELEIGTLAGIEMEALDLVWPAAVKGTRLEKAVKKVHVIQGKGQCMECKAVFDIDQLYDPCPHCHSFQKNILLGKELRVKSLEVS